jgi:nickel-dependent lactate racemase
MQIGIDYGREHIDFEVAAEHLVGSHRFAVAPALPDPAAAVRQALETPSGFPPLRRALTPDDHVVIVIDEHLPHVEALLAPVVEHILEAGVARQAITILCPESDSSHAWLEERPPALQDIAVEFHDPRNRQRLSYLATTRHGRRIYLNRTAVDADQIVVLAGRGYDPLLGYSGAEASLFPALSDSATQRDLTTRVTNAAPGKNPGSVLQEATEVAWLLGAPFMVQVIEGMGDELAHVLGGLAATNAESRQLLNARWRLTVDSQADTVVASLSGDPARHDFAALARALAAAARVVKPGGRIILLSQAAPHLGPGAESLRRADDPESALAALREEVPPDMAAAFQWASAAQQATVYLLSGLPREVAEELFTTPLDHAGQAQRLLNGPGSCLFLEDAHKIMAVVT